MSNFDTSEYSDDAIGQSLLGVSRIADPSLRASKLAQLIEFFGDRIARMFDAPPVWKTDLVDGAGNHIDAPPRFNERVRSDGSRSSRLELSG